MGCISSKEVTRSMSIREELNQGFQSATSAWEELLASHSGNDQLFALICSSNSTSTKLRTSSFTLPSTDSEKFLETKHLGGAWDLITEIGGKADVQSAIDAVGESDFSRFTRSKSCQMARDKEILRPSPDQLNGNKLDLNDKNQRRSRSFHTVEEYDALLERIHEISTSIESSDDCLTKNSVDESQNQRFTQETGKDSPKKQSGIEDDLDGPDALTNSDNIFNGARETGWKRKSVAKGLKSLDVSTLEFPAVARFRQRIRDGQIYSPETYITPKFGSYNGGATEEKECVENTVFSPELLAEFEDCMQRLQDEEESILREIDDD